MPPVEQAAKVEGSGMMELARYGFTLGKNNAQIQPFELAEDLTKAQIALVPQNLKIEDLREYIPQYPTRKTGKITLTGISSFVSLVNEQKRPNTRIFGKIYNTPATFEAIVDFHEAGSDGKSGWNQFIIELVLKTSKQYQTWNSINGKMLKQEAFCEFLKDNRFDISDPCGSEILLLASKLEAYVDMRYRGKVPDNTGTLLSFEKETRTNGVTIPDHITLNMPIFEEGANIPVVAEFKFRPDDGTLQFGIRLIGIEKMMRDAVNSLKDQVSNETCIPVFV
jgi:uncharacterized protein YfdQ (DUF2303 family)